MGEYNPKIIEPKWQGYWEENKTFKTGKPGDKKIYILDMFPYTSGSGLHIGHPEGYTATDIYSRYKRANGFSVLHPMGFDAFGLPAEQHAVSTGEHPSLVTEKNCQRFTEQLKRIGFSYDWDRVLATYTPDYYKWTQWIFIKLYNVWFDSEKQKARPISELPVPDEIREKGGLALQEYQAEHRLAYYTDAMVNWCPALGTVLANEEVINGRSERGSHEVVRKPMKQWMLRITNYAERLLKDIDAVDWPESIKEQQRNWIGKKFGAEIHFELENSDTILKAFTTRPDTLFGVTFFVVSPEHEIVPEITTKECHVRVKKYCDDASKLSDFSRTLDNRKKTGVFTGSFVINPISGEKVPVYVGDYVLLSYGTGAVMGVPAHDERDFDFARTYQIPIVPVIEPGAADDETLKAVLCGEVSWTGTGTMLPFDHVIFKELALGGMDNKEAGDMITDWLSKNDSGKKVTNYKLRDWLFSRQRYWGEPIPIIHWEDGRISVVDESELPLELPIVEDYKPNEDGESPLSKAGDWLYLTDSDGVKGKRETNTMPQWAGSCWYYLRFIDPKNSDQGWDPELEKSWMPVDLYVGGAEHAVLHLLYARFWHKVLFDLGYVSTNEPFQKLFSQGMIVGPAFKNAMGVLIPVDEVEEKEDGTAVHLKTGDVLERITAKMSKSLRNVVSPDDVIDEYGADVLRLYEMFMGPLEMSKMWDANAITGCHRFVKKVWTYFTQADSDLIKDWCTPAEESKAVVRAINLVIKKVGEDIEALRFNTAISAMMEFMNSVWNEKISKDTGERFLILLSCFAPHVAEELWSLMGNTESVALVPWPTYDESALEQTVATVVIQVNGKKRGMLEVDVKISSEDLQAAIISEMAETNFSVGADDKFISVIDKATGIPKLVNVIKKG